MGAFISVPRAIALAALVSIAACGPKKESKPPPPEVGVVVMAPGEVPLTIELVGRVKAFETSQVRPQVSGIVRSRLFDEGSNVRQGQVLYEIQPDLYRSSAAQGEASLANALAAQRTADVRAARFKALIDADAVSRQDYADAVAAAEQAAAQVALARAGLDAARTSLRFTRVEAPISGRIGRSLVTTGALATTGQIEPMAVIEKLDPVFVDIQQASSEALALHRRTKGQGGPSVLPVKLILEDGEEYPLEGRVEFEEAVVDPNTASVTLRARFPNPDGLLLPGMFVRARLAQVTAHDAILAPQGAVSRSPDGQATVMIVDGEGKASTRLVKVERTVGANWLVTEGLAKGDRLITEGLGNIKEGQEVRVVPAGSPPALKKKAGGK